MPPQDETALIQSDDRSADAADNSRGGRLAAALRIANDPDIILAALTIIVVATLFFSVI